MLEQEAHVVPDDKSVVEPILSSLKDGFKTNMTKDIEFRKQQIRRLIEGHRQLKNQINDALRRDLGCDTFTCQMVSHLITDNEMEDTLSHIDKWSKSKSVKLPILVGLGKAYIKPEPLGVALVISAWNYPLYTSLPFVAVAMAAGNCVILKPSQMSPHTSRVLKKLFDVYLDQRFYRCIEGKVQVAKTLVSSKVDVILFTGSTRTGTYVATQAAKNLVPCVLELGGKCPVVVDATANIRGAARRIVVGKFMNCGQTCVAGDYVYAHTSIKANLQNSICELISQIYGKNIEASGQMGKIITKDHVKRLAGYLQENHNGRILCGGQIFQDNQFIQPTVISDPKPDCSLMNEEIFGPLLPIIGYNDLSQVIESINSKPKPLVVYCFSSDCNTKKRLNQETSSGAFVVNDVVMQLMNPNLPFGGVGKSGYGRYHGRQGFDSCSNLKSCMDVAIIDSYPMSERFPPYTPSKQKMLLFLFKNFSKLTKKSIFKFLYVMVLIIIGIKVGRKMANRGF